MEEFRNRFAALHGLVQLHERPGHGVQERDPFT